MINFVTIDGITKDLLFLIRGSKVSESETISWNQIEFWIHQYRALLLKQDLDKGRSPNPDYIQEIPVLKLEKVNFADDRSLIKSNRYVYRTELQLPKTIDLNYKSGFTYVGTIDGEEIQLVPQSRSIFQKFRRYVNHNTVAYLRNRYIYVESYNAMSAIVVRGIFEIPTEVSNIVNASISFNAASSADQYPIPINMLTTLKQMILKQELNIIISTPSDNNNDGNNDVTANAKKE